MRRKIMSVALCSALTATLFMGGCGSDEQETLSVDEFTKKLNSAMTIESLENFEYVGSISGDIEVQQTGSETPITSKLDFKLSGEVDKKNNIVYCSLSGDLLGLTVSEESFTKVNLDDNSIVNYYCEDGQWAIVDEGETSSEDLITFCGLLPEKTMKYDDLVASLKEPKVEITENEYKLVGELDLAKLLEPYSEATSTSVYVDMLKDAKVDVSVVLEKSTGYFKTLEVTIGEISTENDNFKLSTSSIVLKLEIKNINNVGEVTLPEVANDSEEETSQVVTFD